jgi:hypothetical protein
LISVLQPSALFRTDVYIADERGGRVFKIASVEIIEGPLFTPLDIFIARHVSYQGTFHFSPPQPMTVFNNGCWMERIWPVCLKRDKQARFKSQCGNWDTDARIAIPPVRGHGKGSVRRCGVYLQSSVARKPTQPAQYGEHLGGLLVCFSLMATRLQRLVTIAGVILVMGSLAAEHPRVVIGEVRARASRLARSKNHEEQTSSCCHAIGAIRDNAKRC